MNRFSHRIAAVGLAILLGLSALAFARPDSSTPTLIPLEVAVSKGETPKPSAEVASIVFAENQLMGSPVLAAVKAVAGAVKAKPVKNKPPKTEDPVEPPVPPVEPPVDPPVEPPAPPVAPGAVASIACVSGDMFDLITYSVPTAGGPVEAYSLSRATSPEGPYSAVATAGQESTSFQAPVTATGTYYYTVTARGPGGEGRPSEAVNNGIVGITSAVSTAGATLRSSNGEIALVLPPAAFSETTTVTISEVSGSPVGTVISFAGIYDIEPSGTLGAPATLSISYTLAVTHHQVSDTLLRAAGLLTYSGGDWIQGATDVRAEDGFITGEVDHFSPWTPGSPSPHGISGDAVNYCTGVCHELATAPDSTIRYSTRDSQVCYNCHGNTAANLPAACGIGDNVQAEMFAYGPTYEAPAGGSRHPVVKPGAYTTGFYCTLCHDPHAASTTSPDLLKAWDPATGLYVQGGGGARPGDQFCWTCHGPVMNRRVNYYAAGYYTRTGGDKKVAYSASAHAGIPNAAGSTCERCHTEHGSTSASLLNASYRKSTLATVDSDRATGAYAQACLQCHDGGTWLAQGAANIKQYVTYDAGNTGAMSYGGHRILSAGGTLPVNAPLPCTNCHGPHGSLRNNTMLLSDALGANFDTTTGGSAAVRKFCFSCHTTPDGKGWDSTASAYVPVGTTASVEGLRRDGGVLGSGPGGVGYNWLRLKVTPGHAVGDTQSCYLCHGNAYGTGSSKNVHNPDSYSVALHTSTPPNATITIKGVSYGPYACSTCHNLELEPEHDKTTASTADTHCGTCHPTPRSSLTPSWNRNTCAQGNCHAGTSTAPMHAEVDADHTAGGPCTASGCHSVNAAAIHAAPPGPGCPACHGPGITPTLACRACHANPHPTANHGDAVDECGSCHPTNKLTAIHADDCARCHPNPAQTTTYTGGCQQAGCHPTPHTGMLNYPPWQHSPHGEQGSCWDCHPGDGGDCYSCHTWDHTAPVTTSDARASYTSAAAISLAATDSSAGEVSGVAFTYFQVDGGPLQTGNTAIVPGPPAGAEEHTLEFWSIDNAFNTEVHKIVYFTVRAGSDPNPPAGTMAVNNGAAYTNSLSATANSAVTDAESGIAGVRVDPGTGVFGTSQSYRTALPVTLTGADGLKTVRLEYKDVSNNALIITDTITVDRVLPVGALQINANASATNSTTVTLNSNVSDAHAGVSHMSFSNTSYGSPTWEPYSPTKTWTIAGGANGTRRVYAQYRDAAGNVLYVDDTINYDIVAPTGTMTVNDNAVFTAMAGVTVNSAVTDAYSGLDQMRVDPGTGTFGAWGAYSAALAITLPPGDGVKTVRAEYRDRAGNVLSLTDTIEKITINDPTPPTGTVVINGGAAWTNSMAVVLTLDAADTGGSGLYQMRFSNDNTNWSTWEPYGPTKNWTISSGTNPRTVYAQFRDGVGNISASATDTISRETVIPTGTIVINGGAAWTDNANVTLTLTANDTGGSGLRQMRFSNDNTSWSAWEPVSSPKAWTLSAGAALKTVYVQYQDYAGNVFATWDTIAYLLNHTLNYTAGAGGTISGVTPQTVRYGDSGTTVTAVPSSGNRFLAWSDGVMSASRTDVNVGGDIGVTAWFAPNGSYTIRFLDDGGGYVSGQWIQGVLPGGSTTPVNAVTYSWQFDGWSDGTNWRYDDPLVLTNVQSNATWTAYFTSSGSCPFLYTWDGNRYVFEADEFAAGYLGLRTSKGYRRPNPIDYHVLATTPQPKDGALEYKLVEEREETDYLDQVKLYAVDAPADREVYVERSQAEGVGRFTTLNAVIHTTALNLDAPPSVKWLNTGQEVRDQLGASDGDRVILNQDRNVGYNYQTLELDLGDVQGAPQVKLVIDGRTMIPTSQAGRAYSRTFGPQAKLEVQDGAGTWVAVPATTAILPKPPEFDRPFVLDISNIWVSDSRKVRLTYLYKTYLDSVLLDTTADVPVELTELPLESADLQPHGFNFREGVGEWYDYVYGAALAEPRYTLPGNYTKFGEVAPLLGSVDDKFVIFGGGDELTLRFTPPATSAEGLTRRYLFFSNGYYKSLKEDIAHTVEPLPFAAMSNFPYSEPEAYPTDADHLEYLSEWNTRYESE